MTSSSTLSFRQAGITDSPLLSQLGNRSFYQAYEKVWDPVHLQEYAAKAFAIPQLQTELADPESLFLLAFSGDMAAGYAKLVRNYAPESLAPCKAVQIQRFYLLREFTGQRLGDQLMNMCITQAQAEGFDTIWLAVWDINTRAIAFYQRHGFEVCGTYPFKWGDQTDEDLLMKRQLS